MAFRFTVLAALAAAAHRVVAREVLVPRPVLRAPRAAGPRLDGRLGGRVPPRESDEVERARGDRFEPGEPAGGALEPFQRLQRAGGNGDAELWAGGSVEPQRPRGARSRVSRTDAGTLVVDLPAAGFTASSMMGGAFSLAWFSAIAPATFTAGAPVLFLLPFWLAGGLVAKQSVLDPARATRLSIGEFAWEVTQTVAGVTVRSDGGPSEELEGAETDVAAWVNGVPVFVLRLFAASRELGSLGSGLSEGELEWLAAAVNRHLDSLRGDPSGESRGTADLK